MSVEMISSNPRAINHLSQAGSPAAGRVLHESHGGGDMIGLAIDLQKQLKILRNISLDFSVYQGSGKIMVTVIDKDTGEVIREIPPSEMLALAAKMEEAIGLMFDTKA